jgi:hypothetical protein
MITSFQVDDPLGFSARFVAVPALGAYYAVQEDYIRDRLYTVPLTLGGLPATGQEKCDNGNLGIIIDLRISRVRTLDKNPSALALINAALSTTFTFDDFPEDDDVSAQQ